MCEEDWQQLSAFYGTSQDLSASSTAAAGPAPKTEAGDVANGAAAASASTSEALTPATLAGIQAYLQLAGPSGNSNTSAATNGGVDAVAAAAGGSADVGRDGGPGEVVMLDQVDEDKAAEGGAMVGSAAAGGAAGPGQGTAPGAAGQPTNGIVQLGAEPLGEGVLGGSGGEESQLVEEDNDDEEEDVVDAATGADTGKDADWEPGAAVLGKRVRGSAGPQASRAAAAGSTRGGSRRSGSRQGDAVGEVVDLAGDERQASNRQASTSRAGARGGSVAVEDRAGAVGAVLVTVPEVCEDFLANQAREARLQLLTYEEAEVVVEIIKMEDLPTAFQQTGGAARPLGLQEPF